MYLAITLVLILQAPIAMAKVVGTSEFCGPKEREGKPGVYCEVKYDNRNKTINQYIDDLTRDPILPMWPFELKLLPFPLLPIDSNGTMPFKDKMTLEHLYSKALNVTGMELVKDQRFKDDDEHKIWDLKHRYWKQLWCAEADDQCDSLESAAAMKFKTWDHKKIEHKMKEHREQKGLLVLGQRILDELKKNPEKREQCIRTHHYPSKKCDKRGDHCKKWGWDQDYVNCKIDCKGKSCLRIGPNGNYLA